MMFLLIVCPPLLMTSLLASGGKIPSVHANMTTAMTLNHLSTENIPFAGVSHPFQPSLDLADSQLFTKPFPTGAWWTNLLLGNGDQAISPMPYSVKATTGHDFHISYPFRVVTSSEITQGFASDFIVSLPSAVAPMTRHYVRAYDDVSVIVQFQSLEVDQWYRVFLVRGAPYITVQVQDLKLKLSSQVGILDCLFLANEIDFPNGHTYRITLNNGHQWLVFGTKDLHLDVDKNVEPLEIHVQESYTGILRLILINPDNQGKDQEQIQAAVSQYAAYYPTGMEFQIQENDSLDYQFHWKIKSMFPASVGSDDDLVVCEQKKIAMLALPHHMDILRFSPSSNSTIISTFPNYFAMKGLMTAIEGSVWNLDELVRPSSIPTWFSSPITSSFLPPALNTNETMELLTASLIQDLKLQPSAPSTYTFGKQAARFARLILIADQLNLNSTVQAAVITLEDSFTPWFSSSSDNVNGPRQFLYDQTYGGILTKDAMLDSNAEFGAGYYNDHHFHYGYMLYALAVLKHFNSTLMNQEELAIKSLARDIGTITSIDPSFPRSRHKDLYTGHSWASGLFEMATGKAQESSSEAVNAYYALMLFTKTFGHQEEEWHHFAQLMLAMEIRSVQKYWHMNIPLKKNGVDINVIYEPAFAHKNGMVGVLSESQVSCSTWFGNAIEFVHGINMMPFTPITEILLPATFSHELVRVEGQHHIPETEQNRIWRTLLKLNKAIVDPEATWYEMTHASVGDFDDGNSKTNALYWILTRPSWSRSVSNDTASSSIRPRDWQIDTCFGFPVCAVAANGDNPLNCCQSLPGCCNVKNVSNSLFGCCTNASSPIPVSPTKTFDRPSFHSKKNNDDDDNDRCFHQPACATAGPKGTMLGCCLTSRGCCPGLGCCVDDAFNTADRDQNDARASAPKVSSSSCFGQPTCAIAGKNQTALSCCATSPGCCPGLGCCTGIMSRNSTSKKTKVDRGDYSPTSTESHLSSILFGVAGMLILLAVGWVSYQRFLYPPSPHRYEPIDGETRHVVYFQDERIGFCMVFVLLLVGVIVFLYLSTSTSV